MIRWSGGAPSFVIVGMVMALCALIRPAAAVAQTGEFGALFEALKDGLYTVEVVDRASGNKNAQGSGFRVDAGGVLATNYHVVSEYVLDPERYSLRFRNVGGETGPLDVLALDVLHDLALVRFSEPDPVRRERATVFDLADDSPRNGATLLALGNPYDIGLSLVPGTYNGMLENQYRKLIHFTGALNPGMSGGPAVDVRGQVVGINVAGAGNSVSFLVPVSNLSRLIERAPTEPRP
ncbi:MAG: S1C family serine protease, partial [Wenzhouxiangellaceae bacterium]